MFYVSFIIPYAIIDYLNIHTYITYIVYNLGGLGVVHKIQVIGFLQIDK